MINRFDRLEDKSLIHGITTRIGGVSVGGFGAMNTGVFGLDNQAHIYANIQLAFRRLEITAEKVIMTRQTHSSRVKVIETHDDFSQLESFEFDELTPMNKKYYVVDAHDAMITNRRDVVLMTFHADCVPIIVYDPDQKVVAAVHSGWKGTSLGILTNVLNTMVERFGCDPGGLIVGIGQSADICCYEVKADVIDAMKKQFSLEELKRITSKIDSSHYKINLKEANKILACRAGIQSTNIEVIEDCTICNHTLYHSHRAAKGGNRGMMSIIVQLRE